MKMPWNDKTGLAKATAIFATLLLVSVGLCGANFVGVMAFSSMRAVSGPVEGLKDFAMDGLTFAGIAESLGMIVGALGLFIVAIAMVIRAIMQSGKNK
jgi:hypothetical protein